jgi:hypothetical protein
MMEPVAVLIPVSSWITALFQLVKQVVTLAIQQTKTFLLMASRKYV